MILTKNQLEKVAFGYEQLIENDGFYNFYRFTEEELLAYKTYRNQDLNAKTLSPAGVRLSFITNSQNFGITFRCFKSSSRPFGHFDVYENGILTNHFELDNIEGEIATFTAKLSPGEKHLEVYFPWAVKVDFKDVLIDDNASITPVKRDKNILCYGDSITHGYDAIYPSLSYSSKLAKKLNADIVNKAIGGEIFFPELSACKPTRNYDFVTVAYGSNDWSLCCKELFIQHAKEFLNNVYLNFKNTPVYVITPIWRGDNDREPLIDIPFFKMHDIINDFCKDYPNFKVINGVNLTPHLEEFYSDKYLHPNDLGFSLYTENLYNEILKNSR